MNNPEPTGQVPTTHSTREARVWFERLLKRLLLTFRNRPADFSNAPSIAQVCINLAQKGLGSGLRGLFYRPFLASSRGAIFIGAHTKILNIGLLSCGKNIYIGPNSYIDCLSKGGVSLGDNVTLREGAWVQVTSHFSSPGEELRISDNVYIGPRATLGAAGVVYIGSGTQIGANFSISAENHLFDGDAPISGQGVRRSGISVGEDCWIGNNVVVLDGVTIGNGCVIGAGSVVTKDIAPLSVVVGNPARFLRKRGER